jgi:hypothetical protein
MRKIGGGSDALISCAHRDRRRGTCAGEDEIAHASEAAHRQRMRPQSDSQTSHLAQPASDERGPPVAAKAQAIADAAAQGQHILQCSSQFHTCITVPVAILPCQNALISI